MNNLKAVLNQLRSDKVKERQEGINSLRNAFARDSAIDSIDEAGDGRAWLVVFQALFTAVVNEKAACTKKTTKSSGPTAAALKRLNDAASAVRWLTERCVQRLSKKVVKPLLNHLFQTMVHQGQLYSPVSLDYVKAIRCIVSYAPHLEHLDEEHWLRAAEMGFNVVLRDSLRTRLDDDEDLHEDGMDGGTDAGDSVMEREEDDVDELPSTSAGGRSLKRRWREGSATPGPSRRRDTPLLPRTQAVSLEQIEFTSLLVVLLVHPSAPLLSSNHPNLASGVLKRLLRFIRLYPVDTSLHQDYLLALSATLSHVALNKRDAVTHFARGAWDHLIGLWGTKNKGMKEGLVVVLRMLLSFYTASESRREGIDPDFNHMDGVAKLWQLLDGEADSRWGIDGLSLECLRFEISQSRDSQLEAFIARTFRYGWNFDSSQALAWAILELQADCAAKLYVQSESIHSPRRNYGKKEGKRIKLDNPISSLLDSIRVHAASSIRAYHLQILLFFIDRHWTTLHEGLQQNVMSTLLQFVSFDDAIIQSWTFLCFAAIAERQVSSSSSNPKCVSGPSVWDPIWTHAMRRADVPIVCRAACHAAYILLLHMKSLLTSQRVLLEIETFAKDLDVQGPPFPHDSVCIFLSLCLQVASQDMRLYRMHIEDKVLSWLIDNWSLNASRTAGTGSSAGEKPKISPPMVSDIMMVLESICGLSKRSTLICRTMLPECAIVDEMREERQTAVIRMFLLHAELPRFRHPQSTASSSPTLTVSVQTSVRRAEELAQPGNRERRVSSGLLKLLESLVWENGTGTDGHIAAERARRLLDVAVIAICFESLLVFNGIKSNKRVLRTACKVVSQITPLLTNRRWTMEEKTLVLMGFEPLVLASEEQEDSAWTGLLPPDEGTGIRKQVLKSLTMNAAQDTTRAVADQRKLQRTTWQLSDIQDTFAEVLVAVRDVLRTILSKLAGETKSSIAMDVDDKDDFAPVRTAAQVTQPEAQKQTGGLTHSQYILSICVSFLALGPTLQSASGEATRDRELADIILNTDGDEFLVAGPAYFAGVRQKTLNLSLNTLDNFLDKFESLLKQYPYARAERLQLLTVQLLDSTSHLWVQDSVMNSAVGENIRALCHWLLQTLNNKQIRSWRVRDNVVAFLDRYLAQDPMEQAWFIRSPDLSEEEDEPPPMPTAVLPELGSDEDIRVRFRVASANARLFSLARIRGDDPMPLYKIIGDHLCKNLELYEPMLTRLLTLGSIMVVSSAVRRGPYWHLLETCHYTETYTRHIECILNGVSERMGLSKPSDLFEVYASQVAASIHKAKADFLRFPPSVMGYHDRKECAKAAFHAFAPAAVLVRGDQQDIERGRQSFINHCKAIQIPVTEGFRDCFAEIFGYDLTTTVDLLQAAGAPIIPPDLEQRMISTTESWGDAFSAADALQSNMDTIVVSILQTLGDQDVQEGGPILQELRLTQSERAALIFQVLTRYRHLQNIEMHQPNLPYFGTATILSALQWFSDRLPAVATAATSYHVLHQMIARIQTSPLVNEQIRSLNALCLWIACHYRHFREPILLHTLTNAASSLLAQFDLARGAQSILEWAFGQYAKTKDKDGKLADVLIRICSLAHDYSLSDDIQVSELGLDLIRWLEQHVIQLAQLPHVKSQIVKALPAWPREPCAELMSIYQEVPSHSLSSVLADPRIASNKFRVVRRLRDLSLDGKYPDPQFSRIDFWRLKECIPPPSRLQDDDISAFAALLLLHKGQIYSFGINPLSGQLGHNHHALFRQRSATSSSAGEGPRGPEQSILEFLLAMLDADSSPSVHTAYHVLRCLASTHFPETQVWSAEQTAELEYFRVCPQTPAVRRPTDLKVLLTEAHIRKAADFHAWISETATLLGDALATEKPFYGQLAPILRSDVSFAEETLPILVHTILSKEVKSEGQPLRSLLSKHFTAVLSSSHSHVFSVRAIVNIVLHLRHFMPASTHDALAYDHWLDLDFILLSRSAIVCGAYTTALLFHELAFNDREDGTSAGPEADDILFTIYSRIEEPDSFYGIRTQDFRQFLMKKFHHEQQWDKAFRFHGASLEADRHNRDEAEGVLHSLHSFGFDHLAMSVHQMSANTSGVGLNTRSMGYDLGWRTETWDLPEQVDGRQPGAALYQALRAINRERDPRAIDQAIKTGLSEEMNQLRILGDEDLVGIHEVTKSLACLNQVEFWRSSTMQLGLGSKNLDAHVWSTFSEIEIDSDFEFSMLEGIMATRLALLRSTRQKEQRQLIGSMETPFVSSLLDIEKRCLVRLSEAARDSQNIQVALNSVVRAQQMERTPSVAVSREFAHVLWLQKEHKLAVQFLKNILARQFDKVDTSGEIAEKALLLALLGSWSAEACLEKPTDIWESYFHPAATLLNDLSASTSANPESIQASVYHECAVFADRQYHATSKVPEAVKWRIYAERKAKEVKARETRQSKTVKGTKEWANIERELKKAKKLLNEDEERFTKFHQNRNTFLQQAIDMYSRCLHATDTFNDDAHIRLTSLWFSNFDDSGIQDNIQACIDRIPSRKFVFLAHQLSARLSGSKASLSQQSLQSLIVRMCNEHPFHSLYQLYCLRLMSEASISGRRQSGRHDASFSQGDRTTAANEIFDRLRTESSAGRVRDVERVCEISLEWAKYPIKQQYGNSRVRGPYPLPETIRLRKLRDVHVPVITAHTPVDPTLQYRDCVWISHYEPNFDTAGGINLPKINWCRGSDGNKYKQLFKGEGDDDLRQDAVMEQVFDLVNVVLQRDRETRKRNLSIRGYKVIPLAAQAGVLEFVENTAPLSHWLSRSRQKYRPTDISHKDFGNKMSELRGAYDGKPELEAKLLELYLQLKQRFRPTMRHWFTEKHKLPMSWFALRLNYTRSVATTSIVGHILGLGDRHTSNILIDNSTGEVVHIDLGISFEQGKVLNIPECVPFRMTADMVDGMGTAGTQGVCQRCAEETLRVLRDGSEVILTVLEVFKYDPLHSWQASDVKMKRAQGASGDAQTTHDLAWVGINIDMSSGGVDEAADRALGSVARKLDRALSVEYTVNELVAEATDPANLACMFMGWSPFQ